MSRLPARPGMVPVLGGRADQCPTCGRLSGGPFTPSELLEIRREYLVEHPELADPPKLLPEDTELARKVFEEAGVEFQRLRSEWFFKQRDLAATSGADSGRQELAELVEYLAAEVADAEQRLDEIRNAYYALQHRDTAARIAADVAESKRAFDERQAARAVVVEERKNALRAKFGNRRRRSS